MYSPIEYACRIDYNIEKPYLSADSYTEKEEGKKMVNNYFVWVEITANRELILEKERFAQAMQQCANCGIDSVILSIKDTSGFVLYPSQYAPHYSKYDERFLEKDYLQQCLEIIHEKGMKIYASFDVFTEGNKRRKNPCMKGLTEKGWMCEVYGLDQDDKPVVQSVADEKPIQTIGSIDDFGEIFVNPANDEVVQYELCLIEEVMNRYEIDGIVLDRVRYVGLSSDFSQLSISKWKQASGIEGEVNLDDIYQLKKVNGEIEIEYGKYFGSFNTFRAQLIHDFIRKVRKCVDNANKKIDFLDYTGSWYPLYYLMAANWASPEHLEVSYPATDAAEYAKTGYIRYVDRMLSGFYYEDVEIREAQEHQKPADWYSVEGSADIAYAVTKHEKPILGSLYLFQYKDDPANIQRAIDMCFRKSDGCMLFDLSYLVQNNWWKYAVRQTD
ncbi:MAG: family 10 glycosylhydrolase [Clostridia bacterium]|nr:family 10 glycosylhydrolase [Clostridia bacterium]